MDKIAFMLQRHPDYDVQVVGILINDRSLIDLVREAELPFATREGHPELAGSYEGLIPAELGPALLKYGQVVTLLGCECGEPPCWPLYARVSLAESRVSWSDFQQPHRGPSKPHLPQWQYDGLRFVFDRTQYETAVQTLLLTPAFRGGTDHDQTSGGI